MPGHTEVSILTNKSAVAGRTAVTVARRRGLLRLALVSVLILVAAGYVSPAYNFYTRSVEISAEKGTQEELLARNGELLQEKERLLQEPFIEAAARQELGLVKPGEQSYIVEEMEDPAPLEEIATPVVAPETSLTGLYSIPFISATE
ncbi:MAG: septum formation initiator family protein [Gaiellales bacterium]|nr:MAG: septum formation initiator family protein [Gaiellales bacterium]